MDRPIFDDDLTTLNQRHTTRLLRMRRRAREAVAALEAAEHYDELHTTLADLARIVAVVRRMFAEGEVNVEDMPFEAVVDGWRVPAGTYIALLRREGGADAAGSM